MTVIASIKSAVIAQCETSLGATWKRISNPYDIEGNSYLQLQKGFGVVTGPGTNTERYVGCLVTWERQFTIILVKKMATTQNNIDMRDDIEIELLDAHDVLRKAFHLNKNLGGLAIDVDVSFDDGMVFVDTDRLKFLSLPINLAVEYQEDPNT